jgi:hypothetical protein
MVGEFVRTSFFLFSYLKTPPTPIESMEDILEDILDILKAAKAAKNAAPVNPKRSKLRELQDDAMDLIKTTYKERADEIRAKQDANGPLALLLFIGEENADRSFCLETVQVKKELLDPLVELGSLFEIEGETLMNAAIAEIFDRVFEKYDREDEWDFERAVEDRTQHEEEREEEEETDEEEGEEEKGNEGTEANEANDGNTAKKRRVELDLRDPLNPSEPKIDVIRTFTSAHLLKNIRPEDLARVNVAETMYIDLFA